VFTRRCCGCLYPGNWDEETRPGFAHRYLPSKQLLSCEAVLFRETSTLGIRLHQQRAILSREIQGVETEYGMVRVKVERKREERAIANVQPEYEDCAS